MTELHQIAARAAVGAGLALLAAALWSITAGRRSAGRRDHRFAADRLVIVTTAAVAVAGLIGIGVATGGGRPAEPLHLLYGPAAFVTPIVGWWLGGRGGPRQEPAGARQRRDRWLILASLLLIGLELRLAMTG